MPLHRLYESCTIGIRDLYETFTNGTFTMVQKENKKGVLNLKLPLPVVLAAKKRAADEGRTLRKIIETVLMKEFFPEETDKPVESKPQEVKADEIDLKDLEP